MSRRLADLYRNVAVHATADLEHRAALELLALVMLADHTITDEEVAAVREISTEWSTTNESFEDALRPAIETARRAIAEQRVEILLDRIDERINSRVLRSALLSAAREVAGVDDDVTPEEGTILADLAARLG